MPNIFQLLYEELMNDLMSLKSEKDKNRNFIDKVIKKANSLSFDVFNNDINMKISDKVEINKQYRQSVINSETIVFFPLVQKFLRNHFHLFV